MEVVKQRTQGNEGAQTWTHDRVLRMRGRDGGMKLYRVYVRDDASYSTQGNAQLTRLSDGVLMFTLDGGSIRSLIGRSHYNSPGVDSDFDAVVAQFAPVMRADA